MCLYNLFIIATQKHCHWVWNPHHFGRKCNVSDTRVARREIFGKIWDIVHAPRQDEHVFCTPRKYASVDVGQSWCFAEWMMFISFFFIFVRDASQWLWAVEIFPHNLGRGIFSIQTVVATFVSVINVEGSLNLKSMQGADFLLCIRWQFIAKGMLFLGRPCVCTCVITH